MLRTRERHATVEEARRAMVSAGYQLPPQCQPSPIARRAPSPPTLMANHNNTAAMPAVARRRHSISCSPVGGVMVSPSMVPPTLAEPPQVSHKRRFSFPAGDILSAPLTAFLPPEFKRRRVEAPTEVQDLTPVSSVGTQLQTQPVMTQPLSPCLPPHMAATPDHLRLVPGAVTRPQPMLAPVSPQPRLGHTPLATYAHKPTTPMAIASMADLGNVEVVNQLYNHYPVGPTSSPSSPGNNSDGEKDGHSNNSNNTLTKEEALAEKDRKAQRVAEILDLMDRQNSADSPTSSSAAAPPGSSDLWSSADVRRRRVGKDQTGILDLVFKVEPMPGQAVKKRLADGLGMTYKQVQIWFQNKRARCKRAVEAPPRASHTFHNVLVSSDGRFMMKELAKGVHGSPMTHYYEQPHHSFNHDASTVPAPPPMAHLRSCILTQ